MNISQQVVVVTGGASGIGKTTAQYLAAQQAKVVILDKNEKAAQQLAHEIQGLALPLDVTSESQVSQAFKEIKQHFAHPLVAVVNCAGIAPAHRVVGKEGPHPLDLFEQVIAVNLIGTFNILRVAAFYMAKNEPNEQGERGVIINTASIAGYEGQVGQAAYSASKGGIIAMNLPIARELARFGIRVMTVAPGLMETPLLAALSVEIKHDLMSQTPFPHRFGHPEEYAQLVVHILENAYLNGEVIRLDGALRMK